MRLAERVVTICDLDIGAIVAALPPPTDPLWDLNSMRQRTLRFQNDTRSILFRWLDNDWKPGMVPAVETKSDAPEALARAVEACAETLKAHRPGTIAKLMLAELRPGGEIALHADSAPALTHGHRCHVPIVSDPAVRFTVDGQVHYLEPGTAYEIDNTRRHAVVNASGVHRVHVICDILP